MYTVLLCILLFVSIIGWVAYTAKQAHKKMQKQRQEYQKVQRYLIMRARKNSV